MTNSQRQKERPCGHFPGIPRFCPFCVLDKQEDEIKRLRGGLEKATTALENCRYSEQPLARQLRKILAASSDEPPDSSVPT